MARRRWRDVDLFVPSVSRPRTECERARVCESLTPSVGPPRTERELARSLTDFDF